MRSKLALAIALIILQFGSIFTCASAANSAGVKKGDWIEYQVKFTGDATLGHAVTWARIEVTDVQGATITLNITTESSNGTLTNEPPTILSLDSGQLGDDFIIPANLKTGTFFDKNQGNINITGTEEKTVAGAERTILTGANPDTTYHWDRSTGILVEANSTYTDYAITTIINRTNMWQPQLFGLDPAVFYALVAGAAIVLVAAVTILIISRRKIIS
jgi:hypothetical protein